MKAVRHLIYASLLLNCLSRIICTDIQEFLVNLPANIGDTISTAWTDFINTIKTPMRLRKRKKKIKKKHTSSTSTTQAVEYSEASFEDSNVLPVISNNVKPTIPVFYPPEWTRWLDWKAFERPSLLEIIEKMRGLRTSTTERFMDQLYEGAMLRKQNVAEENDDHLFGVLLFI